MAEVRRNGADAPSWGGAPFAARVCEGAPAGRSGTAESAEAQAKGSPRLAPARISLVYESRDKRLCLFEDAAGHLTAVRASRLA